MGLTALTKAQLPTLQLTVGLSLKENKLPLKSIPYWQNIRIFTSETQLLCKFVVSMLLS